MQDQRSSARAPVGYRWTKGRAVADPRLAGLIRDLYSRHARGGET